MGCDGGESMVPWARCRRLWLGGWSRGRASLARQAYITDDGRTSCVEARGWAEPRDDRDDRDDMAVTSSRPSATALFGL